jgi:hypothetical protein
MAEAHLSPWQQKWFDSVRSGLERDTGKSLDQWVAIAKTCPETAHRARLKRFKDTHGLLQNRASYVLGEAFGREMAWDQPDALIDALWTNPDQWAIFEAVRALAMDLDDVVMGPRKGFTGFSRKYQFAAAMPRKAGPVRLGLAVAPEADAWLSPRKKNEPLNERLFSMVNLETVDQVDERIAGLLRAAWGRS